MSPETHLTPNQRFYLGEISASEAIRLEKQRVIAEKRAITGYGAVDKVLLVLGVLLFLPVFVFNTLTHRRH
ncbi:MAG TPA: hypothetical protein VJZ00_23165 [Thermoanaerobaculia bacterium]|nr:hypothetical protein [Thermoanaerobaculia bacterium]